MKCFDCQQILVLDFELKISPRARQSFPNLKMLLFLITHWSVISQGYFCTFRKGGQKNVKVMEKLRLHPFVFQEGKKRNQDKPNSGF